MNKIVGDGKNGKFLLCILEPGNLERLKEGKPIEFNTRDLFPRGLPAQMSIAIAFSETPVADAREIAKMVEPGGIHEDTRAATAAKKLPHCPECKSTVEQLGIYSNESPVWLIFCPQCGSTLGTTPPNEKLMEQREAARHEKSA
jgi:hypothetical protein